MSKAFGCVRQTISVGDVGFDIDHGRAINYIYTAQVDDGCQRIEQVNLFYLETRKANGVGPEWRPTSKDTNFLVTPKTRRSNRRLPFLMAGVVEYKNQPQVGKSVQTADSIELSIFRLED